MTKREELKIIEKALDVAHDGKFEVSFDYFGRSGMQVKVRALPFEVHELGGAELAKFDFNRMRPLDMQHYGKYEQLMNSLLREPS